MLTWRQSGDPLKQVNETFFLKNGDLRETSYFQSSKLENKTSVGLGLRNIRQGCDDRYTVVWMGRAVVDFTRSTLKRELTFLRGTISIKRL